MAAPATTLPGQVGVGEAGLEEFIVQQQLGQQETEQAAAEAAVLDKRKRDRNRHETEFKDQPDARSKVQKKCECRECLSEAEAGQRVCQGCDYGKTTRTQETRLQETKTNPKGSLNKIPRSLFQEVKQTTRPRDDQTA